MNNDGPVWDLFEIHVTLVRANRDITAKPVDHDAKCSDCGVALETGRGRCHSCKLADGAEQAREKRAKHRLLVPPKATRTFTCKECGETWGSAELGNFRICARCKAGKEESNRTKVCAYRHCGQTFTDTSSQNSMSYCTEEHRRREKLIRSGKAVDESSFRANQSSGRRTCMVCQGTFFLGPEDKGNNRCITCRDQRRNKLCTECLSPYEDASPCNNRQKCPSCGS